MNIAKDARFKVNSTTIKVTSIKNDLVTFAVLDAEGKKVPGTSRSVSKNTLERYLEEQGAEQV